MAPRRRTDEDLVDKVDKPRKLKRKDKPKLPNLPSVPAYAWNPLHIENPNDRGIPSLPADFNKSDPFSLFQLFFSEEIIDRLCKYTNRNAELNKSPEDFLHRRSWHPVCKEEVYSYFATFIHMGIHNESCVEDYWKNNSEFGVKHNVGNFISRNRFEQIDRYFYCAVPKEEGDPPFKSTFERVWELSEHLRACAQQFWQIGKNLAIDESMQRFTGRSKEITTIPCKSNATGYKIWMLGDSGYILNWLFHTKGSGKEDGPYRLSPRWKNEGFSSTEAVVLQLASILPRERHILWLDNLFTTIKLLERLRIEGIGAAGTVRTTKTPREQQEEQRVEQDRSALPELGRKPEVERFDEELINVRLYHANSIEWGTKFIKISQNKTVAQFAWRDNNVVLFASTIGDVQKTTNRIRKRPSKTRTGAVQTRKAFGDCIRKELPIPELIDHYNHYMNAIDRFDQLRSYYSTLRVHRKTWKALFSLLFDIVLVDSYKLSTYAEKTKTSGHKDFLLKLVSQLQERSTRTTRPIKPHPLRPHMRESVRQEKHEKGLVKLFSNAKPCVACAAKGRRASPKPAPLRDCTAAELNSTARCPISRRSRYGCEVCQIALCRPPRPCWIEHLRTINLRIIN